MTREERRAFAAKTLRYARMPGVGTDGLAAIFAVVEDEARREAISHRDRALALLRDDAMWGSGCLAPFVGDGDDSKCLNDPPCWEHRRRALLAEVDG